MARILVTGATGFIGRHLVPALLRRGHDVIDAGRRPNLSATRYMQVGNVGPNTEWEGILAGIDAVVHLAGLAHRDAEDDAAFFEVNDAGTARLAQAVAATDVRAMIFGSSIAAREAERAPAGASAYGLSKLAGEAHVRRLAGGGKAGIVLRPPLVYGHDAPGNWQRLQRLAQSSWPLPFGAVANRRSLCSVGNLCHAIAIATETGFHGRESGTYEVADREAVSLADILTFLRSGMGKPRRLVSVPPFLLRLALDLSGREKLADSLLDDLTLEPAPFVRAFLWSPPETARDAIMRSGRLFASGVGGP